MSDNTCVWIFGRGASIACNLTLTWDKPPNNWKEFDREQQIVFIKNAIQKEMNKSFINAEVYRNLLLNLKFRNLPN